MYVRFIYLIARNDVNNTPQTHNAADNQLTRSYMLTFTLAVVQHKKRRRGGAQWNKVGGLGVGRSSLVVQTLRVYYMVS